MEQNLNDKPLSNMQIARYIESLRKEMNFDDEVYGLVKSDLEDGPVSYTHLTLPTILRV